ncbi:histidine kinase famiy protein [Sphingomonas sp. CARO-RG-8B-R24-01]|uniref:histidine kinase famiy protein n=1 Tax=Sphingomonas sp. CARO-RG-8B-R24-01 TaxID=2914831 RepID=UPI001F5744B6|nr:histidine kinase famiy protein [Sphingomonas sp. CARO-RG-8B-R24-01]
MSATDKSAFDLRDENALVPAPPSAAATNPDDTPNDIFFAAVKTTRMPMVVTDPHRTDNPVIFCNEAFRRMTGYSDAEIIGVNCRFLQGPETDRSVVEQVRRAIERREEVSVEILNYRKNGSTFWNALFISPVFDEAGALIYFFASQLDVSRRREAEEALHEAQKMEAVGQLTGGIAHDFNNLLQVIIGYIDMLGARVDPGDRAASRAVEAIGAAAQRGATLTQQLLAFARKQELRDRLLNMNTLIMDFGAVLKRTAGDMTVRYQLQPELWNARVDPVQAEMAMLNIVSNARDASGDDGTITLATRNVALPADGDLPGKLEPGEYVELTITDTGPGIDGAVIDRVFDPFFSTKGVGKGTGLGLAMVYGFMRQSGGTVAATNLADGGAKLTLYFPRASGAVERPGSTVRVSTEAQGVRILMVEDQPEVASLGKALLEMHGYHVVQVSNARTALDVLRSDHAFKLLFSDIVMPGGMNGVELARQVRNDYPGIKVLLTTGYADDAIDESSKSFELLRKPYRSGDLEARVRALIDRPGAMPQAEVHGTV